MKADNLSFLEFIGASKRTFYIPANYIKIKFFYEKV